MRNTRGFSVLELMTVIGIIAILAAAAIPGYFSWRSKQELLRAADEVQTVIQLGKMAAIKENAQVVVSFDSANHTYKACVDSNKNGACDGSERLVRAGSLSAEIGLTTSFSPTPQLTFDGRGLATAAGSVTLSHPRLGSKVVAVAITGIARVQ